MSGLTGDERAALASVVPWSPDALPQVEATVEQIIAARVRTALNEAADAIEGPLREAPNPSADLRMWTYVHAAIVRARAAPP